METRTRAIASAIAVAAFIGASSPSTADVVAGWDFSQYFASGQLSIDGVDYTGSLSANYSNFDDTGNAGAESADFGTMYIDGSFGSSNVGAGSGTEAIVPSASAPGSLESNLDAPAKMAGDNPFDSFSILEAEGQEFTELLSMTARAPANMVFEADASSASGPRSDWFVSFGGKTFSGTSSVDVAYSTNGAGYTAAETVVLDDQDSQYFVELDAQNTDTIFVRFTFDPAGADQPFIDNVAIEVPEPGAVGATAAVLAGLAVIRRRRSAR